VQDIGASVMGGARQAAEKVVVQFDELGPFVLSLAHGQELAKLGGGGHGAERGEGGELLGDCGAKVFREENRPVERHVVSDE